MNWNHVSLLCILYLSSPASLIYLTFLSKACLFNYLVVDYNYCSTDDQEGGELFLSSPVTFIAVAATDFGTTFSGFAFAFNKKEREKVSTWIKNGEVTKATPIWKHLHVCCSIQTRASIRLAMKPKINFLICRKRKLDNIFTLIALKWCFITMRWEKNSLCVFKYMKLPY